MVLHSLTMHTINLKYIMISWNYQIRRLISMQNVYSLLHQRAEWFACMFNWVCAKSHCMSCRPGQQSQSFVVVASVLGSRAIPHETEFISFGVDLKVCKNVSTHFFRTDGIVYKRYYWLEDMWEIMVVIRLHQSFH